jgi:beta-glucosidase
LSTRYPKDSVRRHSQLSVGLMAAVAVSLLSCSEPTDRPSTFLNPKQPVERRVNDLVRRLRPDEQLALVRGAPIDRLAIPARQTVPGAPATAFPANIGLAATWNTGLAEQIGGAIAQQARALGHAQILGPLTDISHSPLLGNVFETWGEDPWLASRLVAGYISGVQGEGEIATAIYPPAAGSPDTRSARETDLRPLEAAVSEAGVWGVALPERAAPESNPIRSFLRAELGFRGFTIQPSASDDDSLNLQVRGILRAMFSSGAFDREVKQSAEVETPAHRAIARDAAAQSIVLLKNENALLPLEPKRIRRIAVIGPNAALNRIPGASYTVQARYSDPPLDALRAIFGSRLFVAATPADTANADAAIVFAGTGAKTEAETLNRNSLDLPPGQNELIAAVAKANRNTVVVLIAGYPVATASWIHEVPALLDAWFPGEEGGHAIADVLTGAVNPSGRLPIAFADFPFGYGLSYTQFEYSGFTIEPGEVSPGQFVEVGLDVRNSGSRAGRETVQLYLRAANSSAPQLLRGFEQVDLNPGESKRVHFTLTGAATARFDEIRQDWVQPQQSLFEIRAASSSADIRATGTFAVTE